jgi:quercetin dioxygenase-like cupin family protein
VRRVSLAAIGLLLVFATSAFAQDPTVVDPDHYTVEFENDRVRVIKVSYGPHEKSVMHEHGPHVAVLLSDGQRWRFTLEDGTTEETDESSAGQTLWAEAGTHLPENLSDRRQEGILVELKSPPEEGCM